MSTFLEGMKKGKAEKEKYAEGGILGAAYAEASLDALYAQASNALNDPYAGQGLPVPESEKLIEKGLGHFINQQLNTTAWDQLQQTIPYPSPSPNVIASQGGGVLEQLYARVATLEMRVSANDKAIPALMAEIAKLTKLVNTPLIKVDLDE